MYLFFIIVSKYTGQHLQKYTCVLIGIYHVNTLLITFNCSEMLATLPLLYTYQCNACIAVFTSAVSDLTPINKHVGNKIVSRD